EDFEDEDDTGVLPGEQVKALRDELKDLNAVSKQHFRNLKTLVNELFVELKAADRVAKGTAKADLTVKGTQTSPDFASASPILAVVEKVGFNSVRIPLIRTAMREGRDAWERARERDGRLARHKALEDEAKQLAAELRATEKK